ncbi:hypothetical protein B0H14DRAFT_2794092 [Mycena olivaceomarginata]|nr:hypothetical protein B0H14DRAFT_2794092 [Mycena olivaceomarginata]
MVREVGDVYLLHPLMVHSATKNATRVPRVITNPLVALKEPFRLSRGIKAGDKFSLVEQKTLQELGFPEGLDGCKIEGGWAVFVPRRIKIQEEMKERGMQEVCET